MTTRPSTLSHAEVFLKRLERLTRADLHVALPGDIVPAYSFPQETICGCRFGYPQPVDLNVSEWVCFLYWVSSTPMRDLHHDPHSVLPCV